MAIDDNTSYELTGYQVKDLAGRIRRKADASAIPTVNDATLTLVQNGTTVGTFTANQSTNTTVNLAGGVYADDPTSPAIPAPWVTDSDIDWSTLPGAQGFTKITGTMSGTSMANIGAAYEAPADGLYFVTAHFNQNGNPGGNSFIMNVQILMAGSGDTIGATSAPNYAGNHNCTITYSRMAWLASGQKIQMRGRQENWNGGIYGAMEVTRIY